MDPILSLPFKLFYVLVHILGLSSTFVCIASHPGHFVLSFVQVQIFLPFFSFLFNITFAHFNYEELSSCVLGDRAKTW